MNVTKVEVKSRVLTVTNSQFVPSDVLAVPFVLLLLAAFVKRQTPPQEPEIITLPQDHRVISSPFVKQISQIFTPADFISVEMDHRLYQCCYGPKPAVMSESLLFSYCTKKLRSLSNRPC